MVSLVSPDMDVAEVEAARRGIDLVCVIDVSGSMREEKLTLVQSTLLFMLTKLTYKDRVSLVTFQSTANRLCPLIICTRAGKDILEESINTLSEGGGTNIAAGLRLGLEVLKRRRLRSEVTALFLLSDGIDNEPDADERAIRELNLCGEEICGPYTIHTFGYGRGHDANVMSTIASYRKGSFNYVEQPDSLEEAFAGCLGRLISCFADTVSIELVPDFNSVIPVQLTKVYTISGLSRVRVTNLMLGDRKDVVFMITLPPSPPDLVSATKLVPITANVAYRLVKTGEMRRRTVQLELELISPTDQHDSSLIDETVLVNFYRVKTSEVLSEVSQLAELGKNLDAGLLLERFIEEIQSSIVSEHDLVQTLIKDLHRSKESVQSTASWQSGGEARTKDLLSNHMLQQASSNVEAYTNATQKLYMSESKSKHSLK